MLNKKELHLVQFNLTKYFSIFELLFIFLINFSSLLSKYYKKNLSKASEINLKVKGVGNINFLSDNFYQNYHPSQIYIDGNEKNPISNTNLFNGDINSVYNIRIIWNIPIQETKSMFEDCSQIIEIDLSKFEASEATSMEKMFRGCSNLNFINFLSFDTSKVVYMYAMFENCIALSSLDLTDFDTSQVSIMQSMFKGCSSLNFLNLTDLKTPKLSISVEMFSGCLLLSSLDFSSFDISGVSQISNMFYNCQKLEYINLNKSKLYSSPNSNNIFGSTPDNLMICTEKDEDKFINLLGPNKIIYCNNQSSYQENKVNCYMKNPTINNNKLSYDLCGENLITKYKEINSDDSNKDCFKEIEGYYLDEANKEYKSCYYSCKTCEIEGNDENNNFIECKSEFIHESNIPNSNYKNCYGDNPTEFLPPTE